MYKSSVALKKKNSMGLNNEKINSRIKNGQIISDYLEKLMNIQGLLKC